MTTSSPAARVGVAPALVAALTLVTIELVRASGPLLDMAFATGVVAAAGTALLTYAVPGPLAGLLLLAGRRDLARAVAVGTIALAVVRLVLQGLSGWLRFGIGLLAVALAIAVLSLALRAVAVSGARRAAGAVALGAAGCVGLQLLLTTWDAVWRHDLTGWVVAVLLGAALLGALRSGHPPAPVAAEPGGARLWVLGPVLALSTMMLANPAFAASQSGVRLTIAGGLLGAGLWFGARLLLHDAPIRRPGPSRAGGAVLTVVLATATALTLVQRTPFVLVTLLVTAIAAALALNRALDSRPAALRVRTAVATASAAGLATILPLLVHQLDYDVPLGFPNELVIVATAAVVGLAAVRRLAGRDVTTPDHRHPTPRTTHHPGLLAAGALVLAGSAVVAVGEIRAYTSVQLSPYEDPPTEYRILSWNLHYGVSPAGDVDLEQVARTIEAERPCVVLLQEVSRGWVMGGGTDMATWLANRLGMSMAFAPAADGQFGNAVLACREIDRADVVALPYGVGPQNRSALVADITVVIPMTSVHLQHREESTATRLAQIDTLLAAMPDGPMVLAGDFNAEPGWPEIDAMAGAGWVSAVDQAGDPDALTSPSIDPRHRIDWVFGRGVAFSDVRVLDVTSSDHRPIVARVGPE